MAVLAADWRTTMRRHTNATDSSVVSDAYLDEYLLGGLWQYNREVYFAYEDDTVALTADDPEAILASDAVEVIWVFHGAREPLAKTDFLRWRHRGVDWENCAPDFPREYVHQGRILTLYPRPNAAAVDFAANLTVRTIDTPASVSDAVLAKLADQDTRIPLYWAVAEFCSATWRRSYGPESAQRYLELYQKGVEASRMSYGRRFIERP